MSLVDRFEFSWLDNRPDWIVFFSPSGVESMLAQYFPAGHDFWKVDLATV
jgi:uroporphyrinogen-III synthase